MSGQLWWCPCGNWQVQIDDTAADTYISWQGSIDATARETLRLRDEAVEDALREHAAECQTARDMIAQATR